jgi:hypothetical protein
MEGVRFQTTTTQRLTISSNHVLPVVAPDLAADHPVIPVRRSVVGLG